MELSITEYELCKIMLKFKYPLRNNTVNYVKFLNYIYIITPDSENQTNDNSKLGLRSYKELSIKDIIKHVLLITFSLIQIFNIMMNI